MLPSGWKLSTLGKICESNLQTGPFGSQLHAEEYTVSGVAVLMPKDLIQQQANLDSAAKISFEKAEQLNKHYLKNGDIIFSRRGDVSRFAIIDSKSEGSLCGTGCLRARPSKKHSADFLSFFLQRESTGKWLEQNAVGQTMPNLNTTILSELPLISATSKSEESKIAEILSTWDQAIATTEKLIENSKAQKKALMQQLLTGKKRLPGFSGAWDAYPLSSVAEIIVSPVDKKTIDGETIVRLCNYTDVYYNIRLTVDINYMEATATESEISRFSLKVGDVVITKDSETPGDIAVPALVSEDLGGVVCGYHLAIVRPKKDLVSGSFLNYLFSQPKIRYYFFTLATGATRFGLRIGGIKDATFHLPNIEEQHKIATILETCDTETENIFSQLEKLKLEKKALMQQLLTGKRRVKVDP